MIQVINYLPSTRGNGMVWCSAIVLATILALLIAVSFWFGIVALVGAVVIGTVVLRAPLVGLLLWLATGPTLSGVVGGAFGEGSLVLTPDRVIFVVVALVMTMRWLPCPQRILMPGKIELLMVLFVTICLFSLALNGGSIKALGGNKKDLIFLLQGYAMPFTGYVLAKNLVRSARDVQWLLWTLVVSGVILAFTGLMQFIGGVAWFDSSRYQMVHGDRAAGTLSSAVEFGLVVNFSCIMALIMLNRIRSSGVKLGTASLGFILLVAVILSKTRAVWIGFMAGVGIVMAGEHRLIRPMVVIASIGGLIAMVTIPFFIDLESMSRRVTELAPIYNRIVLTGTALNMFEQHPLFGLGFGQAVFLQEKSSYVVSTFGIPAYYANMGVPHNEYLHLLVMLGITGLIPYLLIVILAGRRAYAAMTQLPKGSWERDLAIITLASLASFLLNGIVADLGWFHYAASQVFVLLGATEGLLRRHEQALAGATVYSSTVTTPMDAR
jgi:O-antigen ligase